MSTVYCAWLHAAYFALRKRRESAVVPGGLLITLHPEGSAALWAGL